MAEVPKETRIHIGNISPKLYESKQTLTTRLAKFGTITKDLDLRSKALQDHYYGFVTLQLPEGGYEKLLKAFDGLLFMGMKLSINKAKPGYQEVWAKDSKRPDANRKERIKQNNVRRARDERIREASTPYPINGTTGNFIQATQVGGTNPVGYMKSSHMFNDLSGNTKNKPPSRTLLGHKSYATQIQPLPKPYLQAYSKISGGGEIIKGRMRTTPRPHHHFLKKSQTLRVLINGELKTFKCYKTKLWGLENKSASELTFRYVDGSWRSGDDHTIERTNYTGKRVTVRDPILGGPDDGNCGINSEFARAYGSDGTHNQDSLGGEINEEFAQEELKNKSILASLLDKHDFEKPVEIEEDNGIDKEDIVLDKYGRRKVIRYDYEAEGGNLGNDSDEEFEVYDKSKADKILNQFKTDLEKPKEEVYYDEDDEGNELDLDTLGQQYTTEAINNKYQEEHDFEVVNSNEDNIQPESVEENIHDLSEDEFMPKFGAASSTNNTETLRSLFNPGQTQETVKSTPSSFKLALSEDDDDVDNEAQIIDTAEQQELLKQIRQKQQEETLLKQSQKFGLFWPHLESPFLQSQSQLNKIGGFNETVKLPGETEELATTNEGEESAYEKWFWKMRGELSRECKRRKRDVQRVFKKKSSRASVL